MRKSIDCLALNRDNVGRNVYPRIVVSVLAMIWLKIAELALNNNHSLEKVGKIVAIRMFLFLPNSQYISNGSHKSLHWHWLSYPLTKLFVDIAWFILENIYLALNIIILYNIWYLSFIRNPSVDKWWDTCPNRFMYFNYVIFCDLYVFAPGNTLTSITTLCFGRGTLPGNQLTDFHLINIYIYGLEYSTIKITYHVVLKCFSYILN